MVSNYSLPEYTTDIDDGIFDYKWYGNCVFRPTSTWEPGKRTDILLFDPEKDTTELMRDLKIGSAATPYIRILLTNLIKKYWDNFALAGCKRTILGYEFGIDTGNAKPVCCKKPTYGFYESKIIMDQIRELIKNA